MDSLPGGGGDAGPTTHIIDLPAQALLQIFGRQTGKTCARLACVQRLWRDLIDDEGLWRKLLADEFLCKAPTGPPSDSSTHDTYQAAYRHWQREICRSAYRPYVQRTLRMWQGMLDWLAANHPAIRHTIRAGASEQEVDEAQAALGCTLPPAARLIYRLHDGQQLLFDERIDKQLKGEQLPPGPPSPAQRASIFHGLFGGYSFYEHLVSVRMLPLARMVAWTLYLREVGVLDTDAAGQRHVAVAASFNLSKIFVLDCATGLLHTALTSRQLRPAVPPDPLPPVTTRTMMATSRDGLLRWMEEYGSRLEGGMYRAQPLEPGMGDESLGMCLFPAAPPAQAAEVSAGVRVTASCIYVPEMSSTTEFQFAYSIRFALLPPEQQRPYREAAAAAAAASAAQNPGAPGGSSSSSSAPVPVMSPQPLECCQLMTRHWVIRDCDGAITNQVRGEAVIGKYPLLRAGGPEFVYQSCTAQSSSEVEPGRPGSMEGDFQFVEGTMQRPTGPTWPVICPRFQLALPDFVY